MPVQTQMQVRRGTASSWTSTNPTLAAGELGFETDTGKFKIGTGSSTWTGLAYATGLNAITYLYNATAAQTTFSGADANGLTLAYTVGTEQVFLNGALQVRGSDYTATNGTSIVLTSGALASDVLNVIAYGATTITDTYTQAQADARFVQQSTNFFAGKNKILNSDYSIWQRGTSFSNPANNSYLADRWFFNASGSGATRTISQQTFTPGTAPVAGYEGQYFFRYARTVAGTGATADHISQRIEDVRTFAGQTVTLSFWAKVDAGTPNLVLRLRQNFGTGGSALVDATDVTVVLSTSWTRYTGTFTVPSISGKTIGTSSNLELQFRTAVNTIQTLDIWGVQLEAGSLASPFQTATGTLQGELAACQRYYYRQGGLNTYQTFGGGFADQTTTAIIQVPLPATMRVAPTSVDFSTLNLSTGGTNTAVTSLTILSNNSGNGIAVVYPVVASGLTANRPYSLTANNSTSGYLGLSAEL
jgi:hypothetical protein